MFFLEPSKGEKFSVCDAACLSKRKPQILLITANKVTLFSINIVPQLNFELSRRMRHLSLQDPVVLPSPQSQNGILSMHHIKPPTLDTSRNYEAGYKKSDCSVFPLEYCSGRVPYKGEMVVIGVSPGAGALEHLS